MVSRKGSDSSSTVAVLIAVAGAALSLVNQLQRYATGDINKVSVRGHYRKDGRGGHTWVDGHKRSYPL